MYRIKLWIIRGSTKLLFLLTKNEGIDYVAVFLSTISITTELCYLTCCFSNGKNGNRYSFILRVILLLLFLLLLIRLCARNTSFLFFIFCVSSPKTQTHYISYFNHKHGSVVCTMNNGNTKAKQHERKKEIVIRFNKQTHRIGHVC